MNYNAYNTQTKLHTLNISIARQILKWWGVALQKRVYSHHIVCRIKTVLPYTRSQARAHPRIHARTHIFMIINIKSLRIRYSKLIFNNDMTPSMHNILQFNIVIEIQLVHAHLDTPRPCMPHDIKQNHTKPTEHTSLTPPGC